MIDFDKTIAKSFDRDFCAFLEYHLSRTLKNLQTNKFECIWCDGVEVPDPAHQSIKNLEETKEVVTGAWLGLDGQDKYRMTIKLGSNSMK